MVLLCDFSLIFALRSKVNHVLENVESSGRDIKIFSALTGYIERQNFSSPRLSELVAALQTSGPPASRRIFQLGRLVDWLDSSDHMLIRILRSLVLWREQLAISFENWRRGSGQYIGSWVDAVAEFEALSSLAALAYERPDWTAPALLESPVAQFEALEMRHPLLPAADCVPNDLTLDDTQRLLIVSGSNMSGKSTLLRAVGLNCVLAWAGAPVAAGSLSLSCLQIGASIRINDSLQDHRSRFYAEISRIRQIVDLTKEGRAVLFLIDELLSGTNSHDRRIGAAAIVRELMHSNAIGLITTHDLALAHIEQDLTAAIANVHFEDQMNGTQMLFDYKLKPGVVTRSNAIELMRAVGLEV
jgi:DNA mismatch repair ATPase MutS